MIARAGPAAEDLIVASRRRVLGHLEARDADGAAQEMEDHMARLCQRVLGRSSARHQNHAMPPYKA